jgi:hypothetical protein
VALDGVRARLLQDVLQRLAARDELAGRAGDVGAP